MNLNSYMIWDFFPFKSRCRLGGHLLTNHYNFLSLPLTQGKKKKDSSLLISQKVVFFHPEQAEDTA